MEGWRIRLRTKAVWWPWGGILGYLKAETTQLCHWNERALFIFFHLHVTSPGNQNRGSNGSNSGPTPWVVGKKPGFTIPPRRHHSMDET